MEIARTGQVERLLIKGKMAKEQLVEKFEEIVKRNSEVSGDFQYSAYFQLMKNYAQLIAQYTISKALLMKVSIQGRAFLEYETIKELRQRGYKINIKNDEVFFDSIFSASRRVDNLVTRARMKQNEMETLQNRVEGNNEVGFEEVIASLNMSLGFEVRENITLARFNRYKLNLKERAAQMEKQQRQKRMAYG